MSVEIKCPEFWTFKPGVVYGGKMSDLKLPLCYISEYENAFIRGELQIIIHEKIVPHLGYDSVEDVNIYYWMKELTELFYNLDANVPLYIIHGDDQGQPDYRFDKQDDDIYLSIIASELGGRADPNWQDIKFSYHEFKVAFYKFKEMLFLEIAKNDPDRVASWNEALIVR